jgi:hypothetical protein
MWTPRGIMLDPTKAHDSYLYSHCMLMILSLDPSQVSGADAALIVYCVRDGCAAEFCTQDTCMG